MDYKKEDIKEMLKKYDNNIEELDCDRLYLSIIKYMNKIKDDDIQYYNYSKYLFKYVDPFNLLLFGKFLESLMKNLSCECNNENICNNHIKYYK